MSPTTSIFLPKNPHSSNIITMFNDEVSSDLLFEVADQPGGISASKRARSTTSFHAHRIILNKCKSTLLGELCKPNGESVTVVSITDVGTDIFHHMLYYIYGGEISDDILRENAKEIIDAADKYGVVNLKLEAEASLVDSTKITINNVKEHLLYADSKNCALLQEAVMDFIVKNSDKVYNKKLSFENIPGHLITDLIAAINRSKADRGHMKRNFSTMRISDLRKQLHEKGLDIDGSRETMIALLKENSWRPPPPPSSSSSSSSSSCSSNSSSSDHYSSSSDSDSD